MNINSNMPYRGAADNMSERYRRALDPECPPAQLVRFAGDDFWLVRVGVARNPASPTAAVAPLTIDESPTVVKLAKRHPACPPKGRAA